MATKNISITEEAYNRLAKRKLRGNESFSEIIIRITKKDDISRFIGAWSKETADKVEENIKKARELNKKIDKARVKKLKEMFK